jgi:hypothetical protein
MAMTDEERKAEKKRRVMEKMMRMPFNEVVLKVQDGTIEIKDLIGKIEAKIKEGKGNG